MNPEEKKTRKGKPKNARHFLESTSETSQCHGMTQHASQPTRQALAPSSRMSAYLKLMLVMQLLTFKASASAWQKRLPGAVRKDEAQLRLRLAAVEEKIHGSYFLQVIPVIPLLHILSDIHSDIFSILHPGILSDK